MQNSINNHLVVCKNFETWNHSSCNILISKLCVSNEAIGQDSNINFIITSIYEKINNHKIINRARVVELSTKILNLLVIKLNNYHGLSFNHRQWEIIIGHWLDSIITVIIDRYYLIDETINKYNVNSVTIYEDEDDALVPTSSLDALIKINDPVWNNLIAGEIIKFISKSIKINTIKKRQDDEYKIYSHKKNLRNELIVLYSKISGVFSKKNDIFTIATFLPKKIEWLLNIKFGDYKINYSIDPIFEEKVNLVERARLAESLVRPDADELELIVGKMIFKLMPMAYLENYSKLEKYPKRLNWPDSPKLIFTSNSFFVNDIFKIWISGQIKKGAKYLVGQHGNNYGTLKEMHPSIEEKTADYFITWGWKGSSKYIPMFNLRCPKFKKNKKEILSGILLIQYNFSYPLRIWDIGEDFEKYMESQIRFMENLDCNLRKNITVRFHREYLFFKYNENKRWIEKYPEINYDYGNTHIYRLFEKTKLVVHCYDSTGILETLSMNIPTMAFWSGGLEHLLDNAKPYYELLFAVGVFHNTPESLAIKINSVYVNIDEWWLSSDVQSAVKVFCENYSRISKNPAFELGNKIKNIIYD